MSSGERIDVDLSSDTVTRPTADMRRFMCEAEVGDEQKLEDPTVNQLCEMVAELLGKEAAVFLPSGTMCNEIALRVHARPGEEVIAHHTAHPINFETGGPGALAGVNVRAIDGPRGQFDAAAVEAAVRPSSRYAPRTRLVRGEQTSNLGGGSVWSLARLEAVTAVARRHGLATHMDGARLMNAVVARGVSARDYAAFFDSAWIDFTKGLGAPVGAALAGSRAFIDEAWRCKQQMGGAMRQAGIIAAGGVYALRHHVRRLAEGLGRPARCEARSLVDRDQHRVLRADGRAHPAGRRRAPAGPRYPHGGVRRSQDSRRHAPGRRRRRDRAGARRRPRGLHELRP